MTTAFFSLETTGIDDACGATVAVVNDRVFHSGFGKEMDAATGVEVLDFLDTFDTIVGFNIASFHLRVMGRVVSDPARAAQLISKTVDILLNAAVSCGYFSSFDSFMCRSKTDKTWKPTAWFLEESDCQRLIDASAAHIKDLKKVHAYGTSHMRIKRMTKGGKTTFVPLPQCAFCTTPALKEAFAESPPDQSWMRDEDRPDILGGLAWTDAHSEESSVDGRSES